MQLLEPSEALSYPYFGGGFPNQPSSLEASQVPVYLLDPGSFSVLSIGLVTGFYWVSYVYYNNKSTSPYDDQNACHASG